MRLLVVLFLGCTLVACNRPEARAPGADADTPAATANSTASGTTAPGPAVDTANCAFCADPTFVRTCEVAAGARTTLYWNITDPSVTGIGIDVVDDAGNDSPFSEQAPQGSIQTGPWLKPGLTFKLKDQGGNLLQSLVIDGKDC